MQTRELPIPEKLQPVLEGLPQALIVGGAVRDWLAGEVPKDLDIEVYQTKEEELKAHLGRFGKLDEVGKSFGVMKLTIENETFDFSLPRQDSKAGSGHKDFKITYDPGMSPVEAAKRRDITINAMGWNPAKRELIDPFGGQEDLKRKIIRHTSSHFPEDPLRPLRCFQFAARLGMEIAPETGSLCRTMASEGAFSMLPKERVAEEFIKFLLKGKDHRKGLTALTTMGWSQFFPEIQALEGLEQDPEYHPEGDVLTHTAHCLSALGSIEGWKEMGDIKKVALSYAVLCHDLGKASTTKREWKEKAGRVAVTSNGHDLAGMGPTRALAGRIGMARGATEIACSLVVHHMAHLQTRTDKDILKLAASLSPANPHSENCKVTTNILELAVIVEADHSGRPPLQKGLPEEMKKIVENARRLGCLEKPQPPVLSGKRILEQKIPLPEGKAMGEILKRAYAVQIQGEIKDTKTGLEWVRKNKRKILAETKTGPEPLINGKDLMAAGVAQGPDLTKLAAKAYDLQLEGKISTKAEGLKALRQDLAQNKEAPPWM